MTPELYSSSRTLLNFQSNTYKYFAPTELKILSKQALKISKQNVKVRLNRAKRMLRAEIEKMYSPSEIFEFNLVYCDKMVERTMSKIR